MPSLFSCSMQKAAKPSDNVKCRKRNHKLLSLCIPLQTDGETIGNDFAILGVLTDICHKYILLSDVSMALQPVRQLCAFLCAFSESAACFCP